MKLVSELLQHDGLDGVSHLFLLCGSHLQVPKIDHKSRARHVTALPVKTLKILRELSHYLKRLQR
jgi:hypothetical protein